MKRILATLMMIALVFPVLAMAEPIYGYVQTPNLGGTVYIRAEAGAGRPVVGIADHGDAVMIVQKGNTWHKVQLIKNGLTGWMYGRYLNITGSSISGSTSGNSSSSTGTSAGVTENKKDEVLNCTGTIQSSDGFANLRWGPGTNYDVIVPLYNGTTVWVLHASGNWYRVVTSDGKVGFAHSTLVKLSTNTGYYSVQKNGVVRSSDGYANLRSGPNTSTVQIKAMPVGTPLTITGVSGQWYQVAVNGEWVTGYVHRSLLRCAHEARTTGDVYFRNGPGTSYSSRGIIGNGSDVILLATDGHFARIQFGANTGYVSTKYLAY